MEYPKSRTEWLSLRHKHISSTEVAALFGMSPYSTAFETAVVKQAAEPNPEFESSERMEWGICFQHAIAKRIGLVYGVKVRAISGYAIHSYLHCRMGASFDYEIVGWDWDKVNHSKPPPFTGNPILREMYDKHGAGNLEIKSVDYFVFKDWRMDDGTIEAPAHIELQVQHQLACIGRTWAAIGALIGNNHLEVLIRERDDEVCKAIAAKCETFWTNLAKGVLPPVDLPADAAIISALYKYAQPGKVLDAQADDNIQALCQQYAEAGRAAKAAEDAKATAKAQLLMKIGDAEKVLVSGYSVSAGVVGETEIPAYTRKGYRLVRITEKKVKS